MFCIETIQEEQVRFSGSYVVDRRVGATGFANDSNVAAFAEEAD
jgi:hypothetical protein